MRTCNNCKTTCGNAWNDEFCNACEYLYYNRNFQFSWAINDWTEQQIKEYRKFLRREEIPCQLYENGKTKILAVNNYRVNLSGMEKASV